MSFIFSNKLNAIVDNFIEQTKFNRTAKKFLLALETYINTLNSISLDTNTSLGSSNTIASSQNAVKTYVDNEIDTVTTYVNNEINTTITYVNTTVAGLEKIIGTIDASANPNYPSALQGKGYRIIIAGKVGGASGKTVQVNDVVMPLANNAGGTEASVGTSWYIYQGNIADTADVPDSTNKRYVTDTNLVAIGNTSGTNTGNETATSIGSLISGATDKTTPVDADYFGIMNSAASNVLYKLSLSNLKTVIKAYLDSFYLFKTITITPSSDLTINGPQTIDINAGETITAANLVFLGTSITWMKTDANVSTTYSGMLALAIEGKTVGQALRVALPNSFVRNDAWTWITNDMTKKMLYMSETSGAITDTAPITADSATRVIGFVISSTVIYFRPSPDFIVHI